MISDIVEMFIACAIAQYLDGNEVTPEVYDVLQDQWSRWYALSIIRWT